MACNGCDRLGECRACGLVVDCTTPDEEAWGLVVYMPVSECRKEKADES